MYSYIQSNYCWTKTRNYLGDLHMAEWENSHIEICGKGWDTLLVNLAQDHTTGKKTTQLLASPWGETAHLVPWLLRLLRDRSPNTYHWTPVTLGYKTVANKGVVVPGLWTLTGAILPGPSVNGAGKMTHLQIFYFYLILENEQRREIRERENLKQASLSMEPEVGLTATTLAGIMIWNQERRYTN